MRRLLEGRRALVVPEGGLKLERRGFSENVAHAVLLAVDRPSDTAGEIYNVGDEAVWSLRGWIQGICRVLGRECALISMPFSLARPSRPYAGRNFHWVSDIGKIRRLGYRDRVPAEEGLRQTVEWLLEHRPERGGEIEEALGDSWNYEAEDALIRAFEERLSGLRESTPGEYRFRHAYAHPK